MKLIILDRDGVINYESESYIKSPEEWLPIPGSLEAIGLLTQAGYTIVVATNQSGVGRGYYSEQTLAQIHQKMQNKALEMMGRIDHVFYCPHLPEDECECRKPKSGLFQQIAKKYQIDLTDIYSIGDSFRDIQAAETMACRPILVLTGNGQHTVQNHPELHHYPVFSDLFAAVQVIIKED